MIKKVRKINFFCNNDVLYKDLKMYCNLMYKTVIPYGASPLQ